MGPRVKLPCRNSSMPSSIDMANRASIFGVPGYKKTPPARPTLVARFHGDLPGRLSRAPRALRSDATAARPGRWRRPSPATSASASFASGLAREHPPDTRRRILERFREQHGDKRIATLGKAHVERMVTAKAGNARRSAELPGQPTGSDAARSHGRACGPTTRLLVYARPKYRSAGSTPGPRRTSPRSRRSTPSGTRARLALALLLYTAVSAVRTWSRSAASTSARAFSRRATARQARRSRSRCTPTSDGTRRHADRRI